MNRGPQLTGLIGEQPQRLSVGLSLAWLAVLVTPSVYVLLLMLGDRWHMPAPPENLVACLFCLIPVVALAVCGTMVWRSGMRIGWKVGGLVLTVFAMLLQVGGWFVIIVSAVTTAIAPAQ